MRCAVILAVAVSLSAVHAFAQTATFARSDYPFLGNDQIVFDVNRDGRMDLVGIGLTTARVMLGNGDGTFQLMVEYPYPQRHSRRPWPPATSIATARRTSWSP